MNNTEIITPNRQTAINALAVLGFVVLVGAGIWLAVYSTRYIPKVVNSVATAAVYLGSVFTPSPSPGLSVVPTASSTISFGTSTTSTGGSSTSTAVTKMVTPQSTQKSVGAGSSNTYQITPGASGAVAPHGLSDLAVTITQLGYLTTASADSFVPSPTVPHGSRPAVKFTIENIGTNWTGTWRFKAVIPTRQSFNFESDPQQSLAPGESIDYVLGFDQASVGSGQTITITANFDNSVPESSTANDTASADLTVLGS